ncbi:hypothetical protein ACFLZO_00895 [Patescibacteria group bacterium]
MAIPKPQPYGWLLEIGREADTTETDHGLIFTQQDVPIRQYQPGRIDDGS